MNIEPSYSTFVILSCCVTFAFASETGDTRQERKASFSFEGDSIIAAARRLSAGFQERVCIEETAAYSGISQSERAAVKRISSEREKGVSVAVTNATLAAILDTRCGFDHAYEWSRDGDTETVNIYPRTDAPLSWQIPAIAFTNLSIPEVFVDKDLLGLKSHRMLYDIGSGNLAWLKSKISLKETNITARVAMNRVCAQMKPTMRWELLSTPNLGGFFDYILMFRRVGTSTELSFDKK